MKTGGKTHAPLVIRTGSATWDTTEAAKLTKVIAKDPMAKAKAQESSSKGLMEHATPLER